MNSTDWAIQARSRLARRRAEKPATKSGQIRALWPDIEAALAVGQSMKTICTWLAEEAGIALSVTSLTSYVSRIRRREGPKPPVPIASSCPQPQDRRSRSGASVEHLAPIPDSDPRHRDPLANVRASQANVRSFNYRPPMPGDEKDLI
jgi:hypothetical protein